MYFNYMTCIYSALHSYAVYTMCAFPMCSKCTAYELQRGCTCTMELQTETYCAIIQFRLSSALIPQEQFLHQCSSLNAVPHRPTFRKLDHKTELGALKNMNNRHDNLRSPYFLHTAPFCSLQCSVSLANSQNTRFYIPVEGSGC